MIMPPLRNTGLAAMCTVLALQLGGCAPAATGGRGTTSRPVLRTAADSARQRALAEERLAALAVEPIMTPTRRMIIGVPPFATAGSDSTLLPLAFALADLVASDLARTERVRIVERTRFDEVLRELDLAAAGRVDSATAPRVGRLVSAQQLVFGSIDFMPDGRTLRVGARLGDIASATVSPVIDARATLNDILAAEKELVFRLLDEFGVMLTPAERARVEARPTQNLSALLAYGRGVQRSLVGDLRGAASAFREAGRIDPGFRDARLRERQVRTISTAGTEAPILVPGVRPLVGTVSSAVDRVNRPLDLMTNVTRSVTTAADPVFPANQVTIYITVKRP